MLQVVHKASPKKQDGEAAEAVMVSRDACCERFVVRTMRALHFSIYGSHAMAFDGMPYLQVELV